MEHLNRKHPKIIDEKEEYCIRLAALCHDLGMYFNNSSISQNNYTFSCSYHSGHGPFSHAFTYIAKEMLDADKKVMLKWCLNDKMESFPVATIVFLEGSNIYSRVNYNSACSDNSM